jgi:hypothetical protein
MAQPATEAGIVGSATPESDEIRKLSVHSFVISWYGKHGNAEKIIRAITAASDLVTVIYSDPDNNLYPKFSCRAVRRPNNLFFGDKFQACIDAFDSDVMLLIHADCDCDNWSEIPERCRHAAENIPNIGVWAPTIDFNYWSVERTEIDRIPNTSLSVVVHTDAIVVGLTRLIVERMRKADLEGNVYGWGIDPMFNYHTYAIGKISVIDRSLLVRHPSGTQYSWDAATAQQAEFLKQLTPAERAQSDLLDAVVRVRNRIMEGRAQDSALIDDAKQELALLTRRILDNRERT